MRIRRRAHMPKARKPLAKLDDDGDVDARYERLSVMSHEANVSHAGLATLCECIRQYGLPVHSSRATQYRGRKKQCRQRTPYGQLVAEVNGVGSKGEVVKIPVQNPMAALHVAC